MGRLIEVESVNRALRWAAEFAVIAEEKGFAPPELVLDLASGSVRYTLWRGSEHASGTVVANYMSTLGGYEGIIMDAWKRTEPSHV